MLKIAAILFCVLLLSTNIALSDTKRTQETKLRLFQWRHTSVDEGHVIVFAGNLKTIIGEPIPNSKIIIKIDAPCPSDGIIAKGLTDKHGRYYIMTQAIIWDEKDNMIKAHAEFLGNEKFSSSISREQIIVIYPLHGKKCEQ
ncbi:MAG: hypothetical protein ACREAK_06375 [Nitrosarchaeum sp.]